MIMPSFLMKIIFIPLTRNVKQRWIYQRDIFLVMHDVGSILGKNHYVTYLVNNTLKIPRKQTHD